MFSMLRSSAGNFSCFGLRHHFSTRSLELRSAQVIALRSDGNNLKSNHYQMVFSLGLILFIALFLIFRLT